jgi:hypothetical protein
MGAVPDEVFGDDTSHPIPFLGRIDTLVETADGARYYGLVIASPMSGDHRSRQRLRRKLRDYIIDRHSTEVLDKSGPTSTANTKLTVLIHPGSDVSIFEVLAQARPALEEAGFAFEVSTDAKDLGLH